ncbi:Quino protein alcohol dehydrogenase-like protein [Thozetella sp. PMI_491]|nr:Quino protein alcohol dehydrogenase-like protein [Thozetella sp. PMI_491]
MWSSCLPSIGSILLVTAVGVLCADTSGEDLTAESPWLGWGANSFNNRWASTNRHISSASIGSLATHCQVAFPGGLSATASVVGTTAYFPTWNGSYYAFDYTKCAVKWMINVTQVIHDFGPVTDQQAIVMIQASRTSAQIDEVNRILYFGTQTHALIVAADLNTGAVLGFKQLHTHPLAILTLSGTLHGGVLYTGVCSASENVGLLPPGSFSFPPFTGTAVAVRFARRGNGGTFAVVWEVPTLPPDDPTETGNWSGVGIWGSSPPIDVARNQVFFATGNIYRSPDVYKPCANSMGNETWGYGACFPDRVWEEAVLAVDLHSGVVNWVRKLNYLLVRSMACGNSSQGVSITSSGGIIGAGPPVVSRREIQLCRESPWWDVDFGMAPVFTPRGGANGRDILTIGQKNGFLYTLDPGTGDVLLATMVGPGSAGGGISWGIATDDRRAYFTEINLDRLAWQPQPANDTTISNAAFGAADLRTGEVLWETPVPKNQSSNMSPTVVGDLVFTGRANRTVGAVDPGSLVVLKKTTGEILVDMKLDNFFQGGIAVQRNYVMFGTGYRNTGPGSLYVLTVG